MKKWRYEGPKPDKQSYDGIINYYDTMELDDPDPEGLEGDIRQWQVGKDMRIWFHLEGTANQSGAGILPDKIWSFAEAFSIYAKHMVYGGKTPRVIRRIIAHAKYLYGHPAVNEKIDAYIRGALREKEIEKQNNPPPNYDDVPF